MEKTESIEEFEEQETRDKKNTDLAIYKPLDSMLTINSTDFLKILNRPLPLKRTEEFTGRITEVRVEKDVNILKERQDGTEYTVVKDVFHVTMQDETGEKRSFIMVENGLTYKRLSALFQKIQGDFDVSDLVIRVKPSLKEFDGRYFEVVQYKKGKKK